MSDHATSSTDWRVTTPWKVVLAGGVIVLLGLAIGGIIYGAEKNSGGDSSEQGKATWARSPSRWTGTSRR